MTGNPGKQESIDDVRNRIVDRLLVIGAIVPIPAILLSLPRGLGDGDGRPVAVLGTTRDISERRRLEAQLLQSQKMEAIGRLAGGVAHDFNNQLMVILSMTQMLEERAAAGGHEARSLTMIREAAERSAALTQQLLAFSRKQVVQPVVLDLNETLVRLQRTLGRPIGEDVRLALRLGARPALVRIDPTQLGQIVFNLPVNARDAMPTGGDLTLETQAIAVDEHTARAHIGAAPGPEPRPLGPPHLPKPFKKAELLRKVGQMLGRG